MMSTGKETGTRALMLADQEILGKILVIRDQKVMLDRDLAELYGVAPFRMREQVKRNLERFPKTFMFQLTNKELHASPTFTATKKPKGIG